MSFAIAHAANSELTANEMDIVAKHAELMFSSHRSVEPPSNGFTNCVLRHAERMATQMNKVRHGRVSATRQAPHAYNSRRGSPLDRIAKPR